MKTYYTPNNNTLEYQLLTPKTRKPRQKMVIIDLEEHKRSRSSHERLGARTTYGGRNRCYLLLKEKF